MDKNRIPLSAMLAELRKELLLAQVEGKDSELKFQIDDIEIELQVVTTQGDTEGAGVKFWVFNADAKINASEAITQKLKLKLKLAPGPDGKPVNIGDKDKRGR